MKKNVWIHVGMIAAMLAVACVFFSPVLSGMEMYQGDTQKFEAMVKETRTYHAQTGDYALWNSSLFGGMPIYQVGGNPPMKSASPTITPLNDPLMREPQLAVVVSVTAMIYSPFVFLSL